MSRLSVIIPTYNRADVVCEAIESVLAQTYHDFEIIVVDDGSTDNTAENLSQYRDRIQYLYRETNGGVGAARNDGIRASQSEYICFLDSDDLYLPNRLELAVNFLDAHPEFAAVYGDCQVRGPAGEVLSPSLIAARYKGRPPSDDWREVALKEPMHTSTVTIRRSCLEESGLFNEGLRRGQDSELWLRLSYRYRIAMIPELMTIFRRRDTRWPAQVIARRAISVWQTALAWLSDGDKSDIKFAHSRLARAYWLLAITLRIDGNQDADRARKDAIAHCLERRLFWLLIGGLAAWQLYSVFAWARRFARNSVKTANT